MAAAAASTSSALEAAKDRFLTGDFAGAFEAAMAIATASGAGAGEDDLRVDAAALAVQAAHEDGDDGRAEGVPARVWGSVAGSPWPVVRLVAALRAWRGDRKGAAAVLSGYRRDRRKLPDAERAELDGLLARTAWGGAADADGAAGAEIPDAKVPDAPAEGEAAPPAASGWEAVLRSYWLRALEVLRPALKRADERAELIVSVVLALLFLRGSWYLLGSVPAFRHLAAELWRVLQAAFNNPSRVSA